MNARLFIDATGASIGGGFTYLVNVIPRLCDRAPESRIRLLVRHARLADAIPARPNLELVKLPEVAIGRRLLDTYFQLADEARKWRADLYFSVGEMTPTGLPCPAIASFRNGCVFSWEVKQPNLRERLRINALWALGRLSARQCDRILFVSRDSAHWIGDSIGLPEAKRSVVPHGIDVAAWSEAVPHSHGRPYILTVGSIYKHKNFIRLIDGYVEMARGRQAAPDLIIIGDEYDHEHKRGMEASRRAGGELAERIHILGAKPYSEVQGYYAGASLFVFPSYLETFGHPLLEAMAANVPTVASDLPVFREIAGDAAVYADPMDASAIATALAEALRPEVASALVERGRRRLLEFSIDHTVTGTLAMFEEVLAERR